MITTLPGEFECLAAYIDIGKSCLLFLMILYIIKKLLRNYHKAISGLRDTIHIEVHQCCFAVTLIWAIVWAVFWLFRWQDKVRHAPS